MSRAAGLAAAAAIVAAAASVVSWQTTSTVNAGTDRTPATDGAALFRAKGCASCHDGPDTNTQFVDFPSLRNAPEWAGNRRPGMSAAEYLAESIRTPSVFISPAFTGSGGPTSRMPDLAVTDAEVDALVAHLLQG
jgi:cytochrome c551/c552